MKKHVILTNGRTGSNNLVNIINQHPKLVNYGEVLGSWTLPQKLKYFTYYGVNDTNSFLSKLYVSKSLFYAAQFASNLGRLRRLDKLNWKFRRNVTSAGFKDFYINLKKHNAQQFLLANPDVKVVHLRRDNVLERYLSYLALTRTNVAVQRSGDEKQQPMLTVPLESILSDLETIELEGMELASYIGQFDSRRVFNITYEDFNRSAVHRQDLSTELFQFLGVSDHVIETQHKKIRRKSIKKSIDNYSELKSVLFGTRFEKFL